MKSLYDKSSVRLMAQLNILAFVAATVAPPAWAEGAGPQVGYDAMKRAPQLRAPKKAAPKAASSESDVPDMSKLTYEDLQKRGAQSSPLSSCKSVVLVEDEAYQKNKGFWEQYNTNCKDKTPVQTMPSTGMFKAFKGKLGENLSGTLTANAFLAKVGERAVKNLERSVEELAFLRICAKGVPPTPNGKNWNCAEMKEGFLAKIRENGSSFRFSLGRLTTVDPSKELAALARNDHKIYMNSELKAAPGVIVPSGAVFQGDEREQLDKAMKQEYQQARADYAAEIERVIEQRGLKGADAEKERQRLKDLKNEQAFVRKKMSEFKASAMSDYLKRLADAPQLAYLANDKPSDAVFQKALGDMFDDAQKSLKESKEALASNELNLDSSKMDDNLFRFAGYTAVMEQVLAEENAKRDPSSCAVATAILNEVAAVKGQTSVVGMVGLITLPMGVGAFGPKAAALLTGGKVAMSTTAAAATAAGIGIAGGSLWTKHDIEVAQRSERNFKTGLTRYDEAKEDIGVGSLAAATAPLNLIGMKAVIGGIAGLSGAMLARQGKEMSGALKALKGVQKSLKGDKAALSTLDDVVDEMGKKGLLGTEAVPDAAIVKEIGESMASLSPAERKAFAQRLKETFEKLNPLPPNATAEQIKEHAERARLAARVGLGFARNGQSNVDDIAKLLNDKGWTKDSLAGVDKVLSKSRAGYQSKLKGGMSAEAARAEATLDAISQIKSGKPYSALDDAAKKETREMCTCIGSCPTAARAWLDGIPGDFKADGLKYEVCVSTAKSGDTLVF
ncbi:MAG: hypothetical protein NDJ89_13455 [Oligoflexia bacterium]|nr:hypothetical protein [Oligoflexia bacterium]